MNRDKTPIVDFIDGQVFPLDLYEEKNIYAFFFEVFWPINEQKHLFFLSRLAGTRKLPLHLLHEF